MGPRAMTLLVVESPSPTPHSALCPQEWLSRFGYLPPADPETGQLQTPEELSKAIMAMQQFGGLEATGVLGQSSGFSGRWVPTWLLPCTPAAYLAVLGRGEDSRCLGVLHHPPSLPIIIPSVRMAVGERASCAQTPFPHLQRISNSMPWARQTRCGSQFWLPRHN